jgi:hypothetical protein
MSIDKLNLQSPDLVSSNFEKLAELFPNCVTESSEGKSIDFDLLKQELSHAVVEGNKERYRLEWPGKKEAIVTANIPTTKTLRPVREDSVCKFPLKLRHYELEFSSFSNTLSTKRFPSIFKGFSGTACG